MKRKLFACLLAASLIFTGCGAGNSGEAQGNASSAAEAASGISSTAAAAESGDSSGKTESQMTESTAGNENTADPAAADSETVSEESGSESVSSGSTESDESKPVAPEISPDAVPVSPESFNTLGPDAFITLAEYKNVPQIYPEEARITDGVIANINFSGVVEGETEPREGMVGEGYDLKIGSGTFIPGFEEKLIGRQKGDTVVFDCSFPEDYHNEELAGKNTTWTVLVNLLKTDSDEVFNNIVAESIVTAYPQDIFNAIDGIGAFDNEDLKKAYTRRWLTAKAILYKENITSEDETYQSIESMILLTMGSYENEEAAVAAGYSLDLIHYYVEYYMACQVIEDNFLK